MPHPHTYITLTSSKKWYTIIASSSVSLTTQERRLNTSKAPPFYAPKIRLRFLYNDPPPPPSPVQWGPGLFPGDKAAGSWR
jgi:hypothetical protein